MLLLSCAGNFTINIQRSWAPYGADRFYSLARCHFFDSTLSGPGNDAGFFRVVPDFVVQWGIPGQPPIAAAWENAIIPDDPVVLSNTRGTIAYAAVQDPNTGLATNRTTQVYVNYADNSRLDAMGFAPFGVITGSGMTAADAIFAGWGQQPDQDAITAQGDAYLQANFPGLSYVTLTVLEE